MFLSMHGNETHKIYTNLNIVFNKIEKQACEQASVSKPFLFALGIGSDLPCHTHMHSVSSTSNPYSPDKEHAGQEQSQVFQGSAYGAPAK